MKYKVGDKVRIKSWNELVEEYTLNSISSISIRENVDWNRMNDRDLPQDRIVTIDHFDNDFDPCYVNKEGSSYWFTKEMIKEVVTENTELFQKYFDRGLTYYGTLTSDPEKIAKQANKYAEECIKYVRL